MFKNFSHICPGYYEVKYNATKVKPAGGKFSKSSLTRDKYK